LAKEAFLDLTELFKLHKTSKSGTWFQTERNS